MVRIIEEFENNELKNLNGSTTTYDQEQDIVEWLNITLAGLDDSIFYDNVDLSDFPYYITVEYYVTDENNVNNYIGTWDLNYDDLKSMSDNEVMNYLDDISSEVDAAASDFLKDKD